MADSVTQKLIDDLQGKEHPLDQAGLFSYLSFGWVNSYIRVTKTTLFEQHMHSKLPVDDGAFRSFKNLLKYRNQGRQVFGSIVGSFLGVFSVTVILTILDATLNGVQIYIIQQLSKDLEFDIKTHGRVGEWKRPAILLLTIAILSLIKCVIGEISSFERLRINIRIQGGLRMLIFHKLLRIGLVNPNLHDEGSITNNIQIDVSKFESAMWAFSGIFYNLLNFAVTVSLGIYFFSKVFGLFVGLMLVNMPVLMFIIYKRFKIREAWLRAKDKRMTTWKTVYGCLRFFKSRAVENEAFNVVNRKRVNELNW